jgi:hypothetical protein
MPSDRAPAAPGSCSSPAPSPGASPARSHSCGRPRHLQFREGEGRVTRRCGTDPRPAFFESRSPPVAQPGLAMRGEQGSAICGRLHAQLPASTRSSKHRPTETTVLAALARRRNDRERAVWRWRPRSRATTPAGRPYRQRGRGRSHYRLDGRVLADPISCYRGRLIRRERDVCSAVQTSKQPELARCCSRGRLTVSSPGTGACSDCGVEEPGHRRVRV